MDLRQPIKLVISTNQFLQCISIPRTCHKWLKAKPNPLSLTSLQITSSRERWNDFGDVVLWNGDVVVSLVLNLKPFIILVSDKKCNWKIEESNLNQEQRGRQEFVI